MEVKVNHNILVLKRKYDNHKDNLNNAHHFVKYQFRLQYRYHNQKFSVTCPSAQSYVIVLLILSGFKPDDNLYFPIPNDSFEIALIDSISIIFLYSDIGVIWAEQNENEKPEVNVVTLQH